MSLLASQYLSAVVADPARRSAVARFVAGRLADTNHSTSASEPVASFVRNLADELGVAVVASSGDWIGDRDHARLLNEIARAAAESDIFFPAVLVEELHSHGSLRGHRASRFCRLMLSEFYCQAAGADRDRIREHVERDFYTGTCEDCGELFIEDDLQSTIDDEQVCTGCRENNYTFSDYHESWVPNHRAVEARDQDGHRCVIDERSTDCFHFDDELGVYIHEDYEPPRARVIRGYHESKSYFQHLHDDWSTSHNRFFGVELEVECTGSRDPETVASAIHQRVNGGQFGRRVFFERDGSLSNGFELITQPMSLPELRATFEFLRDGAELDGVRSHRTTTCGLHVHVSRTGLSNLTVARAVTFVNDPGNDAFITAIARRYNTGFCNIREKQLETAHLPGDRYEAVNLTGRSTVEFRIFRGSLKFEAVVAAVEFCHALLEFCAQPSTSSLNAHAFMQFCAVGPIASETRIMRAYVDARTRGLFQHSEAA